MYLTATDIQEKIIEKIDDVSRFVNLKLNKLPDNIIFIGIFN